MADEQGNVTHDEAREAEARLLEGYGLELSAARSLIDDVRRYGGFDRMLRERAREDGVESIHRTEDPS